MPSQYPDSSVFYRKLARRYPVIVRGHGCWLEDREGKSYLDGSGGAFVANLGHGDPALADAIAEQARRVSYVSGAWLSNDAVEQFAERLAARAPGDLDLVYPLSSGSEATEAALKLARQYWIERGRASKHRIVALTPGYHGNTLLALSASARESYRTFYRDWLVDVPRVAAPYAYRCACGGVAPLCAACSGLALADVIRAEGAENIAAIILEPIGGSSTGATVPHLSWLLTIRALCDEHEILLIADEVLTGAGRTGTFAAVEHSGVVPDLITFGKGIAAGTVPLSALVAPRRIVDVVANGSGAFLHAQTFSHHAVACAAGIAALDLIDSRNLVERVATVGPAFHAKLSKLRSVTAVGDVRGRGFLAGVELVRDRETKAPFPRHWKVCEHVAEAALDEGLVIWPNGGQSLGDDGDVLMLAPPFIASEAELDTLVERLGRAIQRAVASLPS